MPNQYEGIEAVYGNDLYVVVEAGKQKLIQKDGTQVLKDGFDKITAILKQLGLVLFIKKQINSEWWI